jgi:hypothetical protein
MNKLEPDLEAALAARDAAFRQLMKNGGTWHEIMIKVFKKHFPPGWVGTGEDIRIWAVNYGLPEPHIEKCWGSLTGALVKSGYLIALGRTQPMKLAKSHGRKTPVYRRATRTHS